MIFKLKKKKKGDLLAIISLILFFGSNVLSEIFYVLFPKFYSLASLTNIFPLAGIVTMIIGRIKYPKNKFLIVVMWIFIVLVTLTIVLTVLFMIWCYMTCKNTDTSGCN